jgi:hypothetical protein
MHYTPCTRPPSSVTEVIFVNGSLVLRVALRSHLIPNEGGLIIGLNGIAEARFRDPQLRVVCVVVKWLGEADAQGAIRGDLYHEAVWGLQGEARNGAFGFRQQ